jgi:hypothetical protein
VNSTFATTQGPTASCSVNGEPDTHDLFFKYTAVANGFMTVDTLQGTQGPSTYDTTLQVFDGCGGNELACNDDATAGTNASKICPIAVSAGNEYVIRVAARGANSTGGTIILRLELVNEPQFVIPSNAIAEPGPECTEWVDDPNRGCNLQVTPPEDRETDISLCGTYQGSTHYRTNPNPYGILVHDTDIYRFTLDHPSRITVVGQTEFAAFAFIATVNCGGQFSAWTPSVYPTPCNGAGDFAFTTNETLPAGTHEFGITNNGDPTSPCGATKRYWFRVTSDLACPVGTCTSDFNCDGDFGTDADIESFFRCLGGVCPSAPCNSSADFNGDGDTGTDADIESFFRVLGGGAC